MGRQRDYSFNAKKKEPTKPANKDHAKTIAEIEKKNEEDEMTAQAMVTIPKLQVPDMPNMPNQGSAMPYQNFDGTRLKPEDKPTELTVPWFYEKGAADTVPWLYDKWKERRWFRDAQGRAIDKDGRHLSVLPRYPQTSRGVAYGQVGEWSTLNNLWSGDVAAPGEWSGVTGLPNFQEKDVEAFWKSMGVSITTGANAADEDGNINTNLASLDFDQIPTAVADKSQHSNVAKWKELMNEGEGNRAPYKDREEGRSMVPAGYVMKQLRADRKVAVLPMKIQCVKCSAKVWSEVEYSANGLAWGMCAILTMMGCWCGCCLFPFFIRSWQDVSHKCPACKTPSLFRKGNRPW